MQLSRVAAEVGAKAAAVAAKITSHSPVIAPGKDQSVAAWQDAAVAEVPPGDKNSTAKVFRS